MSYKKANDILPHSLLIAVQQYIDGAYIYIPRKEDNKLPWGANTETRQTLQVRNNEILEKRLAGVPLRNWQSNTSCPQRLYTKFCVPLKTADL